jgi:competence protein ComEC
MAGRDSSSVAGSLPPFVGLSVLLGCGLALSLPWPLMVMLVGAVGAGLAWLGQRARTRWRRRLAAEILVLCLAAAWTAWVASDELQRRWPADTGGERVIGLLTIDSLIEGEGERLQFQGRLSIESPRTWARTLRAEVEWSQPPRPLPQVGERWRVLLRLETPTPARNPGGYDAARQAFVERIHARARVLPWAATERVAEARPSWLRLRSHIAASIRERIVDRDAAALFAGLAVGATETVSPEQWRVFSVTGTTHLVAISGMHVTLFAWLMAAMARRLWSRLPALMYRCDREFFAGVLGVSAATFYAFLAGFGVPTQRTVVMLFVWWAMRLAGRHHSDLAILGLALVAVWLIDPLAPLSAGFWLSFVAMATLMTADTAAGNPSSATNQRFTERLWRSVSTLLRVQWRIGIALLPLTLIWFQSVSVAGLVVNLLAIPIFSFVLVPLVLLGAALQSIWVGSAAPVWWLAERVHDLIWPPLHAIAQSDWAVLNFSPPFIWIVLAAATIAIWLWLPIERRVFAERYLTRRTLILGLSAVLLISAQWRASVPEGQLWVRILDVGDGAAVILRTRHQVIVYDTGESFGSQGGGARARVLPALREWGIDSVDLLVLGSVTTLRLLGAATLANLLPVKEIRHTTDWRSPPPLAKPCDHKVIWRRDGVEFQIRPAGQSAQFCVLRAKVLAGPALLIAERLDRTAAQAIAVEDPDFLRADWVLAPRRGSVRAVSADFIEATETQQVLVSSRMWSDSQQSVATQRWGLAATRWSSTARQGALTLVLSARDPGRLEGYQQTFRFGVWRRPSIGSKR